MINVKMRNTDDNVFQTLVIVWEHNAEAKKSVCFIKHDMGLKQNNPILIMAEAKCSAKDQFSRKAGRKVSLARAVKQLFTRNDLNYRKQVWDAYHNRNGVIAELQAV